MNRKSLLPHICYVVPGLYTFMTRILPEGFCRGVRFHFYGYVITVMPLLFMPEFWHFNVFQLVVSLFSGFALLYAVYEVLYVVNDFIAIKYEDAPTFRANNVALNPFIFILVRACLSAFLLLSMRYLSIAQPRFYDIVYALASLILTGVAHNSIRSKLARNPTHASLRVLRFSFPALCVVGLSYMPAMLVSLLPFMIFDEISYYVHNIRKLYGLNLRKLKRARIPLCIPLSAFLPFQILVLIALNALFFISGNLIVIVISLFRKIHARIIRSVR